MGDELGPIDYGGDGLSDMYYPGPTREYSEKTAELIDREIKAHRRRLHKAEALSKAAAIASSGSPRHCSNTRPLMPAKLK